MEFMFSGSGLFPFFVKNLAWMFASNPDSAALTQIYASVTPDLENGSTWEPTAKPWDVSSLVKDGYKETCGSCLEKS